MLQSPVVLAADRPPADVVKTTTASILSLLRPASRDNPRRGAMGVPADEAIEVSVRFVTEGDEFDEAILPSFRW